MELYLKKERNKKKKKVKKSLLILGQMRTNPWMDKAKTRRKNMENRKQVWNIVTIRVLMLKESCVCSLEAFKFYLVS